MSFRSSLLSTSDIILHLSPLQSSNPIDVESGVNTTHVTINNENSENTQVKDKKKVDIK